MNINKDIPQPFVGEKLNTDNPSASQEKTGTIKDGVAYVFDKHNELSKIGTPEEYSKYLDLVFPESSDKRIFTWSISNTDLTKPEAITKWIRKTRHKNEAPYRELMTDFDGYEEKKFGTINYKVIANVKEISSRNLDNKEIFFYKIKKEKDILILGSKQDIEKFTEYINSHTEDKKV